MLPGSITGAQFTSKASSAGIVDVEFGFIPDVAILIADIDGTSPNVYIWANNDQFSLWAIALSLLITGTTGVITRDTTGITKYDGGETIATAETTDTAGKHVNLEGTAAAANHITAPGIAIPADHQVASGKNIVIGLRMQSEV